MPKPTPATSLICRKFRSGSGREHCLVLSRVDQPSGVPMLKARFDDRDLGWLGQDLFDRLVGMNPAQLEHYFLG